MPLDMARHAAIPLPAPRSAAAGGVGARPGKSLAPDHGRGQAGGLASRKEAAPVALELAVEPPGRRGLRGRCRGPSEVLLEPPPGGERSTRIMPGARPRRGSRAVIPPSGGHGEAAAVENWSAGGHEVSRAPTGEKRNPEK